MKPYILLIVPALCACNTVAPTVRGECVAEPVAGAADQFTLAGTSLDGVSVAAPQVCDDGSYIALTGNGTRRLLLGRTQSMAEPGCGDSGPTGDCPFVRADEFASAVHIKLTAAGIPAAGSGLGPCGDIGGQYDDWNFSVTLNDWASADAAAKIVAEELVRWNIGNDFGLNISAVDCGVPLAEPTPG